MSKIIRDTGEIVFPFVRSAYNYDTAAVSRETAFVCEGESMTKQSFSEEADINTIVRLFGLTGKLPEDPVRAPTYGDFTGVLDYRSALHAVMEAEDSFMQMPPDIRSRFHNDPGAFVDFCSNPANLDEMVRMGLAVKRVEPVKGSGTDVRVPETPPGAKRDSPPPAGGSSSALDGAGGSQT